MNKSLAAALLIGTSSFALHAGDVTKGKIISIDSVRLMQESKEGQSLFSEFEQERNKAVSQLQKMEEEAKQMVETFQKQQALLSKEAVREKRSEIELKEKQLVRKRDEIAEDLNTMFQGRQEALYTKHMTKAHEVFKAKEGAILVDTRAPGILAVNEQHDITTEVLSKVNGDFDVAQKNKKKSA